MMNLNNRIYNELNEWKYSENLLIEHLIREKQKLKFINAILIVISLIGIAGWFRFEEHKIFWTVVLILAQTIRITQNIFFTSQENLFNIKNSINFYSFNIVDLERLYYDYHSAKFKEANIQRRFKELQDKERNLFGKQTFDKIKPNDDIRKLSEDQTDKYLQQIIKNVSNE